jgi:hypothetical protein
MDNVFIERLWWSVKYEEVYLRLMVRLQRPGERLGTILNCITIGGGINALTREHQM